MNKPSVLRAPDLTIKIQCPSDARSAPRSEGTYLWRSVDEKPLYVGTAQNVRTRSKEHMNGGPLKDHLLGQGPMALEVWLVNGQARWQLELDMWLELMPPYNKNFPPGAPNPSPCRIPHWKRVEILNNGFMQSPPEEKPKEDPNRMTLREWEELGYSLQCRIPKPKE